MKNKIRDWRISEEDISLPCPSEAVVDVAQPKRVDSGAYSGRDFLDFSKACFLVEYGQYFSFVIFFGLYVFSEEDILRVRLGFAIFITW